MAKQDRSRDDSAKKLVERIMPKEIPWAKRYVPQVNDMAMARGHIGRLVVVCVNADKQTADVRTVGDNVLTRDVPWELLSHLS
jgi:hypothetical protein